MKSFRDLVEGKGDTKHHEYSKNSVKELELLLKHHKEDLEEGDCDKAEIQKDIKEIEDAIKAKATNESEINEAKFTTAKMNKASMKALDAIDDFNDAVINYLDEDGNIPELAKKHMKKFDEGRMFVQMFEEYTRK